MEGNAVSNGSESNPVDALRNYAEGEFRDIMVELGAERDKVDAALDAIREDASAAMAAGDLEHVKALRHEIPAVMTRAAVNVREANEERVMHVASRVLTTLFGLIAKTIAPVLLLALLVLPGCAMMRGTDTVPTPGIRGLVGSTCGVLEHCARDGRVPTLPDACDASRDTSLVSVLEDEKTIKGSDLAVGMAAICGSLDACLDAWPDLQDYRRRSYLRWCTVLEETAASAMSGG